MVKRLLSALLLCTGLATLGTGCTDVVDIDLEQGETLLVVDGAVYDTPGPYTVKLNLTTSYFANQPLPPARDAVVTITDSEGLQDRLTETSPGIYQTDSLSGKTGNSYTLEIEYGGERYMATDMIRPVPTIDSVYYTFEEEGAFTDEGYFMYYYGPELPGTGDHYRLKLFRNEELQADPSDILAFTDRFVDGNYLFELQINFEPFEETDDFRLELHAISEDHYYFLGELQEQTTNGGLFSDPPANIRTNIVNTDANGPKALGWFVAAGVNSIEGDLTGFDGVVYP
ncbi:MAG: DUF4249 domain-containing protein [Cyclobacteriaceae bacterium]